MSGRHLDVVILGATGYGGGELLRLLQRHPHVRSVQAVSRSRTGQPIGAAHPHLRGLYEQDFVATPDWARLAQAPEPVILSAMPHGALAEQLEGLEAELETFGLTRRTLLVDLSGDFRLDDADAFASAYGREHPCPGRLTQFEYGLPELRRRELAGARRIANPGCFATAVELALLPLAGAGPLEFLAIDAKTGSSGSGAHARAGTHHPSRAGDFRAYKVLAHQHQAEIQAVLEQIGCGPAALSFVPHSAPMVRGIFATLHTLRPAHMAAGDLEERVSSLTGREPFLRRVSPSPRVAAVVGSNFCELGLVQCGRSVVLLAAIDNLVKGMAGQAIQNMNIALGLEETTGLLFAGPHPC